MDSANGIGLITVGLNKTENDVPGPGACSIDKTLSLGNIDGISASFEIVHN